MLIAEELKIIRRSSLLFVSVFFAAFGVMLLFAFQMITVAGQTLWFVAPGSPSFATQIFLAAKDFLVPVGVPVVALSPMASLAASVTMAFLMSILLTFPLGLYLIARFFWPALHRSERRGLVRYILPALVLFYGGSAFGYFVIIPQTFDLLYAFAAPLDVAPLFALDDLVTSVFLLTLVTGCVFLLPIAMMALSRVGLVEKSVWRRHFRGAVVSMVIFAAVVTPDGSGVTAALLSGPLIALYVVGAFAASAPYQPRA